MSVEVPALSADGVALELDVHDGGIVATQKDQVKAIAKIAEGDPDWLPARLEQVRRSVLKELGVENLDSAKAAMAQVIAQQEAQKSAEQKAIEAGAKLEAMTSKVAAYEAALKVHADSRLSALSEEQRRAVNAVAGDDPASQIKTIDLLSPTWSKKPDAITPAAKLEDTAPGKKQPDGALVTPPSARATWEALKTTNPIFADRYLLANQSEIFAKP